MRARWVAQSGRKPATILKATTDTPSCAPVLAAPAAVSVEPKGGEGREILVCTDIYMYIYIYVVWYPIVYNIYIYIHIYISIHYIYILQTLKLLYIYYMYYI